MAVGQVIHGKQKDITERPNGIFEFKFSDRTTVFEVKQPFDIPLKGVTLAQTNRHWFLLAEKMGIRTHFLMMKDPQTMVVQGRAPVDLEFITRYYVEGDLWRRIQSGKVNPTALGFEDGQEVKRGTKLPVPLLEITTKREAVDRLVDFEEALKIGNISEQDFQNIFSTIFELDEVLHGMIRGSGLIQFDSKKEVAIDSNTREIIIVDSFGCADEARYVDEEAYAKGEIVEKSKELFRRHYIESGYHAQLVEARSQDLPDPKRPPLPQEVVQRGTEMYIDVYSRLTGKEVNADILSNMLREK